MAGAGSPAPCTQQAVPLTFSSIWCPAVDTRISVTGSDIIIEALKESAVYYTHDFGSSRGFAPMVMMKPVSDTSEICISAFFKITNSYKVNNNANGGILFLDSNYMPIFKFSIGRSKPRYVGGSSNIPFENFGGNQEDIVTDYTNDVEDGVEYISESYEFGESIFMKVTFNPLTSVLYFFDGRKTYSSTTTYFPTYVSLFMSGEGVNRLDITQLKYNGFTDASNPVNFTIADKYFKLENTTYKTDNFTIKGYADENDCSKLCEITPSCKSFTYRDADKFCGINNTAGYKSLVNAIIMSPNPSPVPLNMTMYIPKDKINADISNYYLFTTSDGTSTSIFTISQTLSLFALCIDNSGGDLDFIALSGDKINTYTGRFDYDLIRHPITTTSHVMAMRLSILGQIFYICSRDLNVIDMNDIILIGNDKTTILDPTKRGKAIDVSIKRDITFPADFKLLYIISTSSVGRFTIDDTNSFTISRTPSISQNPTTYVLSSYKVNGQIRSLTDVNAVNISSNKIIISQIKLMTILPGVLCLITPPGFLENTSDSICTQNLNGGMEEILPSCRNLVKGDFFTSEINVDSVIDVLTRTNIQSSTLMPSFVLPVSVPIPQNFMNGWTFFYQTTDSIFVIQFRNGSIRYSVDGMLFTYVVDYTETGDIVFTDSGGVTHLIYMDPIENKLYDQISDTYEHGPFIKTFSMDLLGNSFICEAHRTNPIILYRFTFVAFNIVEVYVYSNYQGFNVLYLESDFFKSTHDGSYTYTKLTYYIRDTSYFRVDANENSCYISNDTYTGGLIPPGMNLVISGSGVSYSMQTAITRSGFNLNFTNGGSLIFGRNIGRSIIDPSFIIDELIVFDAVNSMFREYRNVNYSSISTIEDVDMLVSGTSSIHTVYKQGVYTTTQSNYNLLKLLVTFTYSDGTIKNCFYDESEPHKFNFINDDSTNIVYRRDYYPISSKFVPGIREVGHLIILKNTLNKVYIRFKNSELVNGENIVFIISGGVTLSNPTISFNNREVIITINESFIDYNEYRIIAIVPRLGSLYRPSTGGIFISKPWEVSTVAGIPGFMNAGYVDSKGSTAKFNSPNGIAIDSVNNILFVADTNNNRIRQVSIINNIKGLSIGSSVYTLAGNNTQTITDGTGINSSFNSPMAIEFDSYNDVLFVSEISSIRQIILRRNSSGFITEANVTTLPIPPIISRSLNYPKGLALDSMNNILFVADTNNNRVVSFELNRDAYGNVISVQNSRVVGTFVFPVGLALDRSNNILFVSDNHKISQVELSSGSISVISGSATSGFVDGSGINTRFNTPAGIAYNELNDILYVSDSLNHRIRRIELSRNSDGTVNPFGYSNFSQVWGGEGSGLTPFGTPSSGYTDGYIENSKLFSPTSIAIDTKNDSFFVSESLNNTIRQIHVGNSQQIVYSLGTIMFRLDKNKISIKLLNSIGIIESDTLNFNVRRVISTGIFSGPIAIISKQYTSDYITIPTDSLIVQSKYEISVDSPGVPQVSVIAMFESIFDPIITINRNVSVGVNVPDTAGDGRTIRISDGTPINNWGIQNLASYTHIKFGTHTMRITNTTTFNIYGYFVNEFDVKITPSTFTVTTSIIDFDMGYLMLPIFSSCILPCPFNPIITINRILRMNVVQDTAGDGRNISISDGTPINNWGIQNLASYTHIRISVTGHMHVFRITRISGYFIYGFFVDGSDSKLPSSPFTNNIVINNFTLGTLGSPPSTTPPTSPSTTPQLVAARIPPPT